MGFGDHLGLKVVAFGLPIQKQQSEIEGGLEEVTMEVVGHTFHQLQTPSSSNFRRLVTLATS